MSALVWSAVWGTVLAMGMWSVVRSTSRARRFSLMDRVQQQVLDISEGARERRAHQRTDPLPFLGSFLTIALYRVAASLPSWRRGSSMQQLLAQAGSAQTPTRYRAQLLAAGTIGAAIGCLAAALASGLGGSGFSVGLLPLAGAAGGAGALSYRMHRRAQRRCRDISEELPGVIELTVLTIAAGESTTNSLARVCSAGGGPLSSELARALIESDSGVGLGECLEETARKIHLAEVHRFVDHLAASLDRGAPIVDVLTAQLAELRQARRRAQVERAGKKDIVMLVPLVFVILPTTVLFAVYPGITVLGTVL